jgi:hypothetical protein
VSTALDPPAGRADVGRIPANDDDFVIIRILPGCDGQSLEEDNQEEEQKA